MPRKRVAKEGLAGPKDRETFDFSGTVRWGAETDFMRPIKDRASAEVQHFTQLTVAERRAAFEDIGYRPLGLYIPEDRDLATKLRDRSHEIGAIEDHGARFAGYYALQDESEQMQRDGVPGAWEGQQALARSPARYRIAAYGRRGGKTFAAAREAVVTLREKPQSVVWVCGRTMESVERCFSEIVRVLLALGEQAQARKWRDSEQEKEIELGNGSVVKGVSLESDVAGLAVDLVIVEEAKYILESQWTKDIRPTLTDKMGRALIISSLDGENFFVQQWKTAKEQRDREIIAGVPTGETEWDYFKAPSWDINFAAFSQGRQSPAMKAEERGMAARDFLELYGAVIMPSRFLVFPEFRPRVHTGHYPWNPALPVRLTCDPSGGANAYAVAALQDYGDRVEMFDEVYEIGPTANAEAVNDILRQRPWCHSDLSNIDVMLVDSAATDDIRRLSNMGWPAEGVVNKPQVWERLPIMRNHLREPGLFTQLLDQYRAAILREMGVGPDDRLEPDDEYKVLLQLEEMLAEDNMTAADAENLKKCSQLFIDSNCFNMIEELLRYRYNENRNLKNTREMPMDSYNHLCDCTGYYIWQYRRFDENRPRKLGSEMNIRGERILIEPNDSLRKIVTVAPVQPPGGDAGKAITHENRMRGFLMTVRGRYDNVPRDFSLLERG